jgi:hypothetical protein
MVLVWFFWPILLVRAFQLYVLISLQQLLFFKQFFLLRAACAKFLNLLLALVLLDEKALN